MPFDIESGACDDMTDILVSTMREMGVTDPAKVEAVLNQSRTLERAIFTGEVPIDGPDVLLPIAKKEIRRFIAQKN